MTDSKSSATQMQRRSRKGCNECRRRHWKCNEAKPSCAYCQSVGRPCVYSRQLSWGGRSFKKSRFGKCLDLGATTINITSPNGTCHGSPGLLAGCPRSQVQILCPGSRDLFMAVLHSRRPMNPPLKRSSLRSLQRQSKAHHNIVSFRS